MVINSVEYMSIMKEHYDLSDPYTRDKVILCTEAQKQTNIESLANRLYQHIRSHVDEIDFGTIPMSKGDITKIDNYENLIDCIDTIKKLIVEYGENTELVDCVATAIDNIQKRKRTFEKAFNLNIDFPMMIYNMMTLSCVSSVSILITTCVEYIKNGDDTIKTAFDKAAYHKSKDHVLFQSLRQFNMECQRIQLDKFMDGCIRTNMTKLKEAYEENPDQIFLLKEDAIGSVLLFLKYIVSAKWVFDSLFFMIRRAVYYYYYKRQQIADYWTIQADFLQMNAENLKYREEFENDDERRKKIYDKQMKWVERFRKIANRFMLEDKKAQKQANDQAEREDRQRDTYDDSGESDGGMF